MDEIKPLLVDRHTARRMLGGIGDTKLYELLHRGEIEGVFLDNKRLFTMRSIECLAERLSSTLPAGLEKRNSNMKFCLPAQRDEA